MNGLHRIRKAKGMTQKELASLACVNRVSIARFEAGKANPTVNTLNKLAQALGCTVTELLDDDDSKEAGACRTT